MYGVKRWRWDIQDKMAHDPEGTWHSLQSCKGIDNWEGKKSWSSRRNGNRILDCTKLSPLRRLWWRNRFLHSCSIIGPTPHVPFWKASRDHCEPLEGNHCQKIALRRSRFGKTEEALDSLWTGRTVSYNICRWLRGPAGTEWHSNEGVLRGDRLGTVQANGW